MGRRERRLLVVRLGRHAWHACCSRKHISHIMLPPQLRCDWHCVHAACNASAGSVPLNL